MAKNTGLNHRVGSVIDRTQFHNTNNDTWYKRGPDGRIMDGKADGTPFKGVAKEPDDRKK